MFRDSFWGMNGFDDLRKYIKSGNNFCSEVSSILQERADAESTYAKALQKLSNKLTKASGTCIGTLAEAWSLAAAEMEAEAEMHKQFSQALTDDICRPMRTLAETQHKTRKPIESAVEKAQKCFADRRSDEAKRKKESFSQYKERERVCEQQNNSRSAKGKMLTDKEMAKLDKNVRKLEESMKKTDKEYHDCCQKAETCRQEWETCVYKASGQLQTLEEERISQMQDFLNKYNSHLSVVGPKKVKSCEKLGEAIISIDCNCDLRQAVDQKGTGPNQPEQLLPEFFAEDSHNTMDDMRRRQALQNYLLHAQQELEKEIKGKEGVEKLAEVYKNKPNFADSDAQADTWQRLAHVNATINYLEATQYKLQCALADLDGQPKPEFQYSTYIEKTRDKLGHNVCVLRVPMAMTCDGYTVGAGSSYRPPADGGQVESPYGDDNSLADGNRVAIATSVSLGSSKGSVASRRGSTGGKKSIAPGRPSECPSLRMRDGPPSYNQATGVTTNGNSRPRSSRLVSSYSADSFDDDEFDTFDHPSSAPICQAKAIYDYAGQHHDELTIQPGDLITVYEKQADGWWQGELNGHVGIFPASYAEEMPANSVHL